MNQVRRLVGILVHSIRRHSKYGPAEIAEVDAGWAEAKCASTETSRRVDEVATRAHATRHWLEIALTPRPPDMMGRPRSEEHHP